MLFSRSIPKSLMASDRNVAVVLSVRPADPGQAATRSDMIVWQLHNAPTLVQRMVKQLWHFSLPHQRLCVFRALYATLAAEAIAARVNTTEQDECETPALLDLKLQLCEDVLGTEILTVFRLAVCAYFNSSSGVHVCQQSQAYCTPASAKQAVLSCCCRQRSSTACGAADFLRQLRLSPKKRLSTASTVCCTIAIARCRGCKCRRAKRWTCGGCCCRCVLHIFAILPMFT
jgi:hypothetical protein